MSEIENHPKIQKIKIIKNYQIKENYFKIVLFNPYLAKNSQPGQFLNIKIDGDIFLRRPFSIHRVKGNNLEILYEVVGKGTEILSQKKKGEYLDVIGPLGKGFNYSILNTQYSIPILVAGGIGVAPLVFLAQKLKEIPNPKFQIPTVLIGARNKNKILCAEEFKRLGLEVKIATDDGSRGFKGNVSDLLKHLLSTMNYELSTIYACGPYPMLKEIAKIAKDYKIQAEVSLERHFACGIGICLGCIIQTKRGNQKVCKDGPVFKTEEIIW
jgi:dihydroorotate dehydrogenase electron transfer subunit